MGKKSQLPDDGGASRDRVLAKMQKDTQAIARRWVAEENELVDSKLQVHYRQAREFIMVYDQYEKYGEWSYERLEDLLTCLGGCISPYLSVSVYIDEQTFSDVVNYNKSAWAGDWRITWEHLVALSRCINRELQGSILTRCMNERLSVQHVNDWIDAAILPARTMGSNNSREVGGRSITT